MKNKLFIILLLAGFFSCEEVDQPMTREFTETSFWKTEQDALDALAACYDNMFNADYFFSDEALSDNAYLRSDGYGGVSLIASGSYDARTGRVGGEWSYHYSGIRKCNLLLENIDKITTLDETKKNRIKAEARFIRAYAHFQLATMYGDVPLVTKVLTLSESKTITRTPNADVIAFVLSELEGIQPDLPVSYPTEERGRITRAAAIGIHARVNLFESNWQAVVDDCEKLITTTANGTFALYPDYQDLFTVAAEYNSEIILDLQYGGSRLQGTQRLFLPQTVGKLRSTLVPTQSLVDNYIMLNGKPISDPTSGYDKDDPFTDRDPRFEATILHHGSQITDFSGVTQTILTEPGSDPLTNTIEDQGASATGYYFQKYYDRTAVDYNSGVNLIMLRYADVLLMYAEAKNELNQMNATIWDQTMRAVRERAGFTEASALDFNASFDQNALRQIIRSERRAELAFEGLRVFDIRRWEIADEVLNEPVKGIRVESGQFSRDAEGYIIVESRKFQAPKHYLWPVPQYEVDQNPSLNPNNPGW
jgi:starch-binding outer membrane protein, SusD/RagB family